MKEKNMKIYVTGNGWLSFSKLTNALLIINKSIVFCLMLNVLLLHFQAVLYFIAYAGRSIGILSNVCWDPAEVWDLLHRAWTALFWINWLGVQATWSRNVRLLCWTSLSLVVWLCSSRYINLHRLSLIFKRFWIPAERVLKSLLSTLCSV